MNLRQMLFILTAFAVLVISIQLFYGYNKDIVLKFHGQRKFEEVLIKFLIKKIIYTRN